MLQALRGAVSRPHIVACLKSTGPRFLTSNRGPSPFDKDHNEDGFMLVGSDTSPSSLRPNLNNSSSTTSDANWAQILQDVDPPSYDILSGRARLSMRSSVSMPEALRKTKSTEMEQRAMDFVFARVFNMDAQSSQKSILGNHFSMGGPLFNNSIHKRPPQHKREMEDQEKLFDEKIESMMSCKSDQELLEWTKTEVFSEYSRSSSGLPESKSSRPKTIHPGIYGRVIARLMHEFRETYNNPHLSIAIFDYTRQLSIISFVTGCTAPSYTELMRTYWNSFRDLQMVLNIAEEMRVNGVQPSDHTKQLYLKISEEVVPQSVWFEGGKEEIMKMVERLGSLVQRASHTKLVNNKRVNTDQNPSS
ncbi:unnamed protein product [Rhizoctonia solani]|uniref:Mtf2-like C-terminal domain-containing protein n=3 Tax=Rhizoctonia solani TaxID=456999 RepID=A0A8H3H513_9AGAM|nr:ECSIT domain protein [Rhizoctonia solani AG-3 Rhs1AP]KEP53644.1 ECSIT domain protein [Rhizoctonia solani 123E]CAE6480722.1 unnamed protein product [Rhizoctonia solani]CAE6513945.1 unnamed protein product [Rhizoctonia solani]